MKTEDIQNLYRHDLSSFMQFAFTELHPHATYHHNWHIDVMAHYLNLMSQGVIKKLIINMPPRMLKSQCVSVAWPAWGLGRDARKSFLCLHGSKSLGLDLHDRSHELMTSRRYQALFPNTRIKEEKNKLITAFKGKRQFMTLASKLTGLGADNIIVDDPMSTEEAHCDETRAQINRQFDENVLQRLSDKKNGSIVVVMQRLHDNDLTGHLLAKNNGWVHIDLSAIALENEVWDLPYGKIYHRPKGELLHEARMSQDDLLETLRSVGGYAFAYQYLQGQYQPRFGDTGKGALWLTPMREGVFYDGQKNEDAKHGFYEFTEADLILPKLFGIGEDPYPSNMRSNMTMEEFELAAKKLRISQGFDKPDE
jgi:hypothetical protein